MAFQELVKGTPDWDVKYNSDFQDVHAQLANKANGSQYIPPNSDLDNYTTEGTFFCPSQGTGITHIPPQANAAEVNGFSLCVLTTGAYGNGLIQYLTTYRSNQIYTRSYATVWQPWRQIASAESPQICDLPLCENYYPHGENKCIYWKNALNEVCVTLYFHKSGTDNDIGDETVAILPKGFHSNENLAFAAGAFRANSTRTGGILMITSEGRIVTGFGSDKVCAVSGHIVFAASGE